MRKLKIPASEAKYIGLEPTWSGPATQTDMIHAYTWYRAVLDAKDARLLVEDYMRWKSYPQDAFEGLAHVEDAWFDNSNVPSLCRMAMRGLELSESQEKLLDGVVPGMVKEGLARKAAKDAARKPKVTSKPVLAAPTDAVGDAISKVEYSIDRGELVDVGGLLKMHSPKPDDLKPEADRYQRLIEEVTAALERTDMECVECYRSYTKRQLRDLLARYSGVLQAINLYCSANVKAPTPRKVKPKTPAKIVAKLRYLDKDDALGITSVDPKEIVGASEVILYNVARRYVQRYVAPLGSKLSVRRSTIDGYDPQLSSRKKLRKPEVDLPRFLAGGGKSVPKTYEAIKAKPQEVNGRVSDDVLIVRVVR